MNQSRSKVDHILNEIVQSERIYANQLLHVEKHIILPLRTFQMLPNDTIDSIFSNWGQLAAIHKKLLQDFEAMPLLSPETVQNAIKKVIPYFKVYIEYVNRHEIAWSTLAACRANAKLEELNNKAQKHPSACGEDLESLLMIPIQRLPRYKLLFEALQSEIGPAPQIHKNIQETITAIDGISQVVNRAAQDSQNLLVLVKLEHEFSGLPPMWLARFGRRLLKQGPLLKHGKRHTRVYTFFLFNDMLCYAHKNSNAKFVLHRALAINQAFEVNAQDPIPEYPFRFAIRSEEKSFIVSTPQRRTKESWILALEDCIHTERSGNPNGFKSNALGISMQNKESNVCLLCQEKFTLLKRRRHCKRCGKLVCSACSGAKLCLTTTGKCYRICDACQIELHSSPAISVDAQLNSPKQRAYQSPQSGQRSPRQQMYTLSVLDGTIPWVRFNNGRYKMEFEQMYDPFQSKGDTVDTDLQVEPSHAKYYRATEEKNDENRLHCHSGDLLQLEYISTNEDFYCKNMRTKEHGMICRQAIAPLF